MEQKNKVFLALLIALVMVVAILSSFGLNFFSGDQPEIVLPSPVITDSGEQSADDPTAGGGFLPVDVTPETVQSVIATLERPENYYRAITIEVATGGDTTGSFYAQVWVDGAWTRVDGTAAARHGAAVHHYIPGQGYGEGHALPVVWGK